MLVLIVADQVVHYSVLSDGWLFGRRIAPYDPPLFCEAQLQAEAEFQRHAQTGRPRKSHFRFDRLLGWAPIPGEASGDAHYDWSGSRRGPQELARKRSANVRRLVTIGCSFTMGEEVADDETWPFVLDAAAYDWEVANLAMGAYGVDQALLRLRRDGLPLEPDEIWLGWLPGASLRVGTLYRPAERHWSSLALFKPRFRLDDAGELVHIPNPVQSIAHTARLLTKQSEFYDAVAENDLWVARAERAYRPMGSSLLHRTALSRMLISVRERAERDPATWLLDETSEIHRLVAAIVLETEREARRANSRFRLIVLPSREDLADRAERGSAYWAPLVLELESQGIAVFDASAALSAAGALESDEFWAPGGHYSPRANGVIAETLRELL